MIKVYGDIMLDRWIIGKADRISPEAPVLVLKEKQQDVRPGGAANLAINIASINGTVGVYGSIANDKEGYSLVEIFEKHKDLEFNVVFDSPVTTVKNRLVGQGGQHIMRWDREETYHGTDAFARLNSHVQPNDIVCISDYNKGTVKEKTVETLLNKNCKVLVDPKQPPEFYKGAYLVKPNMKEYIEWFGKYKKQTAILKMREYNWKNLVVTDGKNGMYLIDENDKFYHFQEEVKEVADVTGAGDTVLAVIAYGIEQGMSVAESCKLACHAAARAVEHRGVHVVTKDDLRTGIIFTNGCFDVLHAGHLQLIKTAKSLGKKLIVGLNSDSSVKKLKGENRPVNNEKERQKQLELLPWVDEVIIFEEDTPYNLIKKIKPDLIVKGGDYTIDTVVGNDIAPVEIIPTVQGFSTTKILENENINNR